LTDRAALLVGVPSCDNDLFAALPDVVSADVTRMTDALQQSGYLVRHCGVGDDSGLEPTGNRIRAAMLKAFREAPAGGILVLYFSGHGVVVDGRSYLVPRDAFAGPDGPDPESLVPLVPRHLESCRARLVVYIVDACRNDQSISFIANPHTGALPYPEQGAFVLFSSCSAGERSRYGDEGSYFTQALAEVLDRRNPARTLDQVRRSVERHLARKIARTDATRQHPEMVLAQHEKSPTPRDVVICEGDHVGEAWRRAVESTPLWRRAKVEEPTLARVRSSVLGIVDECAHHWRESQDTLAGRLGFDDPWSAQDYPVRVLAAAESCLPGEVELSVVEAVALVVAPFLREVAFSVGLRLATGVTPHDFSRTFRDGPRSDLEITHAMHEHVCRRAEGLGRRGRTEARHTLAMWLVHRWLADRSSLWDDPAFVTLCARLAGSVGTLEPSLTEHELCSALGILARCVDADPDDGRLLEELNLVAFDRRIRTLGAVLWIAGVLAIDPRKAPTVVVDHVGIGAELQLPALHTAAVKAVWRASPAGMSLNAVCDHPALLAAFEKIVDRADRVRETFHKLDLDAELAANLPARFVADGLRPENHGGTPVFDVPLDRFRLSDEKVRELLMGRQLYGEPDLAIRELYQNALDACRYRQTRRRYRQRLGRATTDWSGLIAFSQHTDPDGREYIECVDNGVGMSRETLMRTFANAGERFVYRSEFRAEQARWQDLDPPLRLVPNSQFGIGVFSYFMIAEEIHIVTRPVGADDVVASQAFSVRIASSGSLFQVTPSSDMPGGGTRVRLYLTGEDRLSVLRTMRRLLWMAEYAVEVSEEGGLRETWQPERLRYPDAVVEPLEYGDDLWWVSGDGGLAADGIRTNEERFGLVVNLRGQRRPQLTVDRNRLRRWDKDWIGSQIRESLPALRQWAGLTLSWLWSVAEASAPVAETVFEFLVESGTELPVDGSWGRSSAPAHGVGCLWTDRELFTGEMLWRSTSHMWLIAWRVGVWKGITSFIRVEHIPEPARIDGFPVPCPLDAAVLAKFYDESRYYRSQARYGRPSVDELLMVVADEEEPPVTRLRRLRQYAITGLDLTAARSIPPIRHVFKAKDKVEGPDEEEEALLGAVAAWSPPGAAPRSAVGGCLALASAQLQVPLGEVLRRAAALVPPNWTPPSSDRLSSLIDHVFTWPEVNLLSEEPGSGSRPPWIGPVVPPAHVLRASSSLGRSVAEVLALFDRFAGLGYEVAGRDLYPDDLTQLELEALRYVEQLGYRLTPLHLFVLAGQTGTTVSAVRSELGRLAAAGLLRLPEHDPIPDGSPTEDERALISDVLYRGDRRLGRNRHATEWAAVRWLMGSIGNRELGDFEDRLHRRRRLLDVVALRRPVTTPQLVDLAYCLDCSIAAAAEHYRIAYPGSADLSELPRRSPRAR
jgi:Caspase domain